MLSKGEKYSNKTNFMHELKHSSRGQSTTSIHSYLLWCQIPVGTVEYLSTHSFIAIEAVY